VARRRFEKALGLYRSLGNAHGVAVTLNSLGRLAAMQGDPASATRYTAAFLGHVRGSGTMLEALALNNYGVVLAITGNWSDSRTALEESLRIRRQAGNGAALASTLTSLATIEAVQGEDNRALDLANESVDTVRRSGDHVGEHHALLTRSEIHIRAQRFAEALLDAGAALTLGRERRDLYTEGLALRQQAKIWRSVGDAARAMRVQAAAERVLATPQTRRDRLLDVFLMDAPTAAAPAVESSNR
jgi:ATP/maltotriose-dependent transcriptional regulator MalT